MVERVAPDFEIHKLSQPAPVEPNPPARPAPLRPVEQMNREQIQHELDTTLIDPEHPLNSSDARHEAAVERRRQLVARQEALGPEPAPEPPAPEKLLVELSPVPDVPDFQWDPAEVNPVVETLDRYGIPRLEIRDFLQEQARRTVAIAQGTLDPGDPETTERALRTEYGARYDDEMVNVRLFVETLPETAKRALYDAAFGGIGNDVAVIKRMAELGKKLRPLAKRRAEIMADPNFFGGQAGFDADKHAALVAEWTGLQRQVSQGPDH